MKSLLKKRKMMIALGLTVAILATCMTLALSGTLAAPGAVSETFTSPNPGAIPVELGKSRNANVIDAYYWSSSDTRIATVTRNPSNFTEAEIRGISLGMILVTASAKSGVTSFRTFWVVDYTNVGGYNFTQGIEGTVTSKGTMQIPITVTSQGGGAAALSKITWTSLDTTQATVSKNPSTGAVTVTALVDNGYVNIVGECLDYWGLTHYLLYSVKIGRGTDPENKIYGVTVEPPGPIELSTGDAFGFSAEVQGTGTFNGAVSWSVIGNQSSSTTINSSGVLVVGSNETADVLTVRATAVGDPTVYRDVTIFVRKAPVTGVTISPENAIKNQGETQQFVATVQGAGVFPTTVSWQVIGNLSSGTSISDNGLLTIASNETSPFIIVRAVSRADPSKFREARVVVQPPYEVRGVEVAPKTALLVPNGTVQFTATVSGTGSVPQGVTWKITGNNSSGTTITATGQLRVAAGETARTITVTATSTADDRFFDTAVVTLGFFIKPGGPFSPIVNDDDIELDRRGKLDGWIKTDFSNMFIEMKSPIGYPEIYWNLKDIVDGTTDYSGFAVTPTESKYNSRFWIGPDKSGNISIICNYIPTLNEYRTMVPVFSRVHPEFITELTLTKGGQSESFTVRMLYFGLVWWEAP